MYKRQEIYTGQHSAAGIKNRYTHAVGHGDTDYTDSGRAAKSGSDKEGNQTAEQEGNDDHTLRGAQGGSFIHNIGNSSAGTPYRGKHADKMCIRDRYSVIRSIKAIDNCDVAVLILDAKAGVTEQDKKIAGYVHEAGKGLIIMVNKWDLIEKDNHTMNEFNKQIRDELVFAQYTPILYGSALTKQRINRLGEMIFFVAEQQSMRISTSVLNDLLEDAKMINPPPAHAGRVAKIYYMTQVGIKPPTFVLFTNDATLIHFSYVRFIENRLRESFGFEGTPIRIIVRSKKDGEEL